MRVLFSLFEHITTIIPKEKVILKPGEWKIVKLEAPFWMKFLVWLE